MAPSVWSLFRRVPHCGVDERALVAFVVTLLAERLIAAISLVASTPGLQAGSPNLFNHGVRALSIVAQDYKNPELDLTHIAQRVGLSRCHLSHLLRSGTGHPLPIHLNGFRVSTAVLLLRGDTAVKSIAFDVGYRGTGELDRQFSRWWRMSPMQFRRVLPEAARIRSMRESATYDGA